MLIQEACSYKRRDGEIAGPMIRSFGSGIFRWYDITHARHYTDSGAASTVTETNLDLMEEV